MPKRRVPLAIEIGSWFFAFITLCVGWRTVAWATQFDYDPIDPSPPLWFVMAMMILIPGTLFFVLSGVVRVCVLAAEKIALRRINGAGSLSTLKQESD